MNSRSLDYRILFQDCLPALNCPTASKYSQTTKESIGLWCIERPRKETRVNAFVYFFSLSGCSEHSQYFLRSKLTSIGPRKGAPDNGTRASEPGQRPRGRTLAPACRSTMRNICSRCWGNLFIHCHTLDLKGEAYGHHDCPKPDHRARH